MREKLIEFPRSLNVVVWLNLAAFALGLVNGVMTLFTAKPADAVPGIASAAISLLVVIGILKRSTLVRILVLVIAWIGAVLYGIGFILACLANGAIAFVVVIPFAVNAVTIWGLMNSSSRRYFSTIRGNRFNAKDEAT